MKKFFYLIFWFLVAENNLFGNNIVFKDSIYSNLDFQNLKTDISPIIKEFSEKYLNENYFLLDEDNVDLLKAKKVIDSLEASNNYVDLLTPTDLVTLPVGMKHNIGNVTYVLAISEAKFTTNYTEFSAFVRITLPQLNAQNQQQQLFFGANNIRMSHSGGLFGDVNLVLLGDIPIPINGDKALLVLKGDYKMNSGEMSQDTYVKIDCNGFKELKITADLIFSRSIIEPVNADYTLVVDPNIKVKTSFEIVASDWNDIIVEVNLPRFQLNPNENNTPSTKQKGFIFDVNTAILDFSDIKNSNIIVFPEIYHSQILMSGHENLWRGVYIDSFTVVLPKEFKKKNSEERITFEANNLLIDNHGVSGNFFVDDILPINEGEASKWQFSVDHIEAEIVLNQITQSKFNGKIVLPISKQVEENSTTPNSENNDQKGLKYNALFDINEDIYTLSVSSIDTLSFDVFKAKTKLYPNSHLNLTIEDHKFKPKATLFGSMKIAASNSTGNDSKKTVEADAITFQNMVIQSEAPYFQVGQMGYNGDIKLALFPVTLSDIALNTTATTASLQFNVAVNLMSDSGFSGDTTLKLVGNFVEIEGYQRWKYDHLEIGEISINADLGEIKLEGTVMIKNDDPIYGDGFYGNIDAEFSSIEVEATVWFGKTNFRYWYVDTMVGLSKGSEIPVTPPTFYINKIAGGAYYHMTKGPSVSDANMYPSGISYVPNANSGLGFRALLGFNAQEESALHGEIGFEMEFNNNMGINRIFFWGVAYMMKVYEVVGNLDFQSKLGSLESQLNGLIGNSTVETQKNTNLLEYSKAAFPQQGMTFKAGIDAHFAMELNFVNHSFDATLDVFVNTPGNIFSGIGTNGRAGWAALHIDPQDWYLYVGTPTDRIGLRLGVGEFSLQVASYFMMGTQIPGSPPPPNIVAQILGVSVNDLNYMRDINALGNGSGFAFGTDFSIDTGDMKFLIFYARFQAGVGFDIMLKDYGNAECAGSGQIGIDGWYANGQAYAYLQGELGIKIKILMVRKKIPIIQAGAAVLLQAKLPNPSWFRGYVGGNYSLLGGLVKGSFRFKVEFGEECELINGGPLDGIKVISSITPDNDATEIDVFASPQVAFNMKVNTPFQFQDDNGTFTYRILLDEIKVKKEGVEVPGQITWNENNDKLNFLSNDILTPNKLHEVTVKVSFQKLISGSWVTLYDEGQIAQEIKTQTFTTGEAPDYIPIANVSYCYPVINQNYFYKNESNQGYIVLKQGQPYLFPPETNWSQKARYTLNGQTNEVDVSYDNSNKKVSFNIPNTLLNAQDYIFKIVSIPPDQTPTENDGNNYTSVDTGQEGNTIEILNQQAQNTVNADIVETEIITYDFSTSQYNTFVEKMNDKGGVNFLVEPISSTVHSLEVNSSSTEKFEIIELIGNEYTTENSDSYSPLIKTEASLLDNNYYNSMIRPLIYAGYPLEPEFTVSRNTSILGIPPTKAVELLSWYTTYLEYNPSFNLLNFRIPYRYYLLYYYKQDYTDIYTKIVNKYLQNPQLYQSQIQQYNYILNGTFPSIVNGTYKVKFYYMLPGMTTPNSTANFEFKKVN